MEFITLGPQQPQAYFNTGAYVQLILDRANFHEGSLVTGNIQFQLLSNVCPLEVYVTLSGIESVYWKKLQIRNSGNAQYEEIVTKDDTAQ